MTDKRYLWNITENRVLILLQKKYQKETKTDTNAYNNPLWTIEWAATNASKADGMHVSE